MTKVQRNIVADFVCCSHKSLRLNAGVELFRRSLTFARTREKAREIFDLILVEEVRSFLLVVQASLYDLWGLRYKSLNN